MKNQTLSKLMLAVLLLTILMVSCNSAVPDNELPKSTSTEETTTPITTTTEESHPEEIIINYDIGFNGKDTETPSPKLGNLPINLRYNSAHSYVCPDPDNGGVYYTNYGNDNYLYLFKDGQSELILEMPVNFINYMNGSLYFLSNGKNLPEIDVYTLYWGNLYKYDLDKGECELLIDENLTNLVVTENGIYFTEVGEINDLTDYWDNKQINCFMDFNENTYTETENMLPYFYGQYQLMQSYSGNEYKGLSLFNEGEEILILPEYNINEFFMINELFYFINEDDKSFNSLNLKTGEIKTFIEETDVKTVDLIMKKEIEGVMYDLKAPVDNVIQIFFMSRITFINDTLYLATGHILNKYYNDENIFRPALVDVGSRRHLFTDGTNIFTLEFVQSETNEADPSIEIYGFDDENNIIKLNLNN